MPSGRVIEEIFHREAGRVLATLIRLLGDFDLAEEAGGARCLCGRHRAMAVSGHPGKRLALGSSAQAATRRSTEFAAISCSEQKLPTSLPGVMPASQAALDEDDAEVFGDDRLRLIFTCCHPALNEEARIALTLREVCGLYEAVARAFCQRRDHGAASGACQEKDPRCRNTLRDAGSFGTRGAD